MVALAALLLPACNLKLASGDLPWLTRAPRGVRGLAKLKLCHVMKGLTAPGRLTPPISIAAGLPHAAGSGSAKSVFS